MKRRLARLGLLVCVLSLVSTAAFAQGATAALTGTVVDKDGGVIPGATVVVKSNATGVSTTVVTNSDGVYSLPTLDPGMYTVTISLQSFKTVQNNEVRLLQGQTANLKTTLEVGAISDTVNVKAETSLVRTQSPTVTSTITHEFIQNVPRSDRSVLSFMIFLPGVDTAGGAQNSRSSTISGLPQNTINILIDGVSTENNLMSTDGFFSLVTPRLDAVEEVTLTTAAAGADQSAQGSATIRFVTRSGTNVYKGTVYEYFRHADLNANSFVNSTLNRLPKPRATVDQYGGSLGGPIVIPGVVDGHGRAFFFFNQEESWTPNQTSRTRTVLRDPAVQGNFTYNIANPTTVNVLTLAAANGQVSAVDPTIAALLGQIQQAMTTTGSLTPSTTQPNINLYNWLVPVSSTRHSPTGSVDVNLTSKHHLKGTYYWQRFSDQPDTLNSAEQTFPGFPLQAGQHSYRTTGSVTLRSTLSSNIVNEVLSGWQWSPVDFFGDITTDMFANQGGFIFGLPNVGSQLSNISRADPEARNTINWNLDDNFSWLKGNHNFKFGGDWTRITNWIDDWNVVPTLNLGFNQTNDPANSMFNTTNFPGAASADLNNARALYALLTGRVSSIPASAFLNDAGDQYIYNGHNLRKELMDEFGFYATDSWRWKPNVTFTLGLRYELQMPMRETNGAASQTDLASLCGISGVQGSAQGRECNIFNPGSILAPGQVSTITAYNANSPGYATDYNNIGPSVGIAYRPNVKTGFLRQVLGDPEQATFSGGYTRTFNRERIDRFQNVYESLKGPSVTATRGTATGNFCLVCPGDAGWPLLFSQKDRLGAPAFQQAPTFPITTSVSDNLRIFEPGIQVPYTDSWTAGLQRSLGKNMAIEVRYIGNENKAPWASENWNTANYATNGLIDEFRLAQANLRANVAAGRGGTFAYMGPGTGTSPLPIFLAAFTKSTDAGNPANYTTAQFTNAAQFTNSTWTTSLDPYASNPQAVATNLWTGNSGTWRSDLAAAGYPANFLVMNPNANGAQVWRNLGGSTYNSLQIDLRRRFSQGLQIQASYTYARRWFLTNQNFTSGTADLIDPLIWQRSTASQPHAVKLLWVYDIPVGRGRRYGADFNKWVNGVIGGWQFSGSGRVQVPLFRLSNTKLVGMSFDEAQAEFKHVRATIDPNTGVVTMWSMPQDIIDNTRLAFNTDPTTTSGFAGNNVPTGRYFAPACGPDNPGIKLNDCAPDLFFYGQWFGEYDFKFTKRFPLGFKKAVFDFDVEVFNALNGINFNQNLNPALQSTNASVFRTTSQGSLARSGQLVWRVSW